MDLPASLPLSSRRPKRMVLDLGIFPYLLLPKGLPRTRRSVWWSGMHVDPECLNACVSLGPSSEHLSIIMQHLMQHLMQLGMLAQSCYRVSGHPEATSHTFTRGRQPLFAAHFGTLFCPTSLRIPAPSRVNGFGALLGHPKYHSCSGGYHGLSFSPWPSLRAIPPPSVPGKT